ncbi:MAG TPA: hypothetical protein VF062_12305 [Candidatus Limnocylindrales bacterium]
MKRLIVVSVCSAALLAGQGVAAQAAQPTPTPVTQTGAVCDKSGATVVKGLTAFTDELDKAGAAATSGDLANADKSVKQSGTLLIQLSGDLRNDVKDAQNAELKKAVEDVAKEMEIQGGNLHGNGLASLLSYSSKKIEDLSNRVDEICTKQAE